MLDIVLDLRTLSCSIASLHVRAKSANPIFVAHAAVIENLEASSGILGALSRDSASAYPLRLGSLPSKYISPGDDEFGVVHFGKLILLARSMSGDSMCVRSREGHHKERGWVGTDEMPGHPRRWGNLAKERSKE